MDNNPQNDLKKEIEDEFRRALEKQKSLDFKLKLKGDLGKEASAQKEVDNLLTKESFGSAQDGQSAESRRQGIGSKEQGAVSQTPTEPPPKEAAASQPRAKDRQPADKKREATKKEGQQSSAEQEPQAASGENQPNQLSQGQKPPAKEKPGAEAQSPVEPQENQQPPAPATKPEAAQGQAEQAGKAPGTALETAPVGQKPPTPKSPAQEPPAVSPPANPNILKRAWQARRQKPPSQVGQSPAQGLGGQALPTIPASSEKGGKEGGGGKETEETRSPRQYQTDLDKKKKEAKAKQELVKATVEGPAEIEGKLKKLKQIYRIINGTSALTFFGIILTFLTMNAQLIFANASPIATLFKIPIPKLDLWEIGLLLLVDLVVAIFLFFLVVIIYFIITCTGGILGVGKAVWCGLKMWVGG